LYSITTIPPCVNVYNAVLLNRNGIIQQVRTTFLSSCSALQKIDKYITLYTFSPCLEDGFTEGFVPYRFDVDDAEPDDERHSALQEIILTGSSFIRRQQQTTYYCYAELVVAFANKETGDLAEVKDILHGVLDYYSIKFNWPDWKAFSWRKIHAAGAVIVAVSLAK
jgi:hypothetical protein